jgi:hypothetical protein
MRSAVEIAAEARESGRIRISGEIEIDNGLTLADAVYELNEIAETCGYIVVRRQNHLTIVGGTMPGIAALHWDDPHMPGPQRIEVCYHETAAI